jgi:hypothetical protein
MIRKMFSLYSKVLWLASILEVFKYLFEGRRNEQFAQINPALNIFYYNGQRYKHPENQIGQYFHAVGQNVPVHNHHHLHL